MFLAIVSHCLMNRRMDSADLKCAKGRHRRVIDSGSHPQALEGTDRFRRAALGPTMEVSRLTEL